jgi:hypothetical protein
MARVPAADGGTDPDVDSHRFPWDSYCPMCLVADTFEKCPNIGNFKKTALPNLCLPPRNSYSWIDIVSALGLSYVREWRHGNLTMLLG